MSEYRAALAAIDRLEAFGVKLGLENVRDWCARSDHPERAAPVVHVAGTNGKGTTVACLAAIARAHGVRTGTYTSPHIVDFRERIEIDGRPVAGDIVARHWERVRGFVEERGMTYFEAATLIAFEAFREADVELALHEVGLGGRLDATNVVDPSVAVVTNVARDHELHLGESLPEIAGEKAGIFKPDRPALVGDPGPAEVRAKLESVATEIGAKMEVVADHIRFDIRRIEPDRTRFDYASPEREIAGLEIPVAGSHFAADAVLALRAFERLVGAGVVAELDPARARRALAEVPLPGRMEWWRSRGARVLLDVAHNPNAAGRLAATLGELALPPSAFVVGILADKAWEEMLEALEPAAARVWLCRLESATPERRLTEAVAARPVAARPWVEWSESVVAGLAAARRLAESGEAGGIVVTGSFYTVGEAVLALGMAEAGEPYAGLRRGAPAEAGAS